MGIPTIDGLSGNETNEELIDYVGRLQKTVNHLLRHLTSKNITEIGGYIVSDTDLQSADGDVGLSSANDALDPIRIWAGGAVKEQANFRVPKSGKIHATGATIESQGEYPKVILDPEGNFLMAAQDEKRYISISPFSGGTPIFKINDGVSSKSLLIYIDASGSSISPTGDLYIAPNSGQIKVPNWSSIYSIGNGQTLQQALDAAMASPAPAPPPA